MGRDRSWAQPGGSEQETSAPALPAAAAGRPGPPLLCPSLSAFPSPRLPDPPPRPGDPGQAGLGEGRPPGHPSLCCCRCCARSFGAARQTQPQLGFLYLRVRKQTFRQANKKSRVMKPGRFTPFPRRCAAPPAARNRPGGCWGHRRIPGGGTHAVPPPRPDHHSPRGNVWDCVSIPPGWEWPQGVNEGTLGWAGEPPGSPQIAAGRVIFWDFWWRCPRGAAGHLPCAGTGVPARGLVCCDARRQFVTRLWTVTQGHGARWRKGVGYMGHPESPVALPAATASKVTSPAPPSLPSAAPPAPSWGSWCRTPTMAARAVLVPAELLAAVKATRVSGPRESGADTETGSLCQTKRFSQAVGNSSLCL